MPAGSRRARSAARAIRSRTAANLADKVPMDACTSQYATPSPAPFRDSIAIS
jgi:hypothetical protein